MPWIEKRGRTRVVRWKTTNPDGTETVHASGRLTEPKAKALVDKLRAKLPDGRRRKAGVRIVDHSVGDLCTRWKAAKILEGGESSMNYAADAAKRAEAVADAAGILRVSQATGDTVRVHREAEGSRADRPFGYLRAILQWAVDELGVEVDQRFFVASRPPPSAETECPVISVEQCEAMIVKAKRLEQWPLVHCLLTYGWRPITACRLRVRDLNVAGLRITLKVKRTKKPHVHPLFAETVELLRPLIAGRRPDAPLFLSRRGKPWRTRGDSADGMTRWYGDNLHPIAPDAGGTNALKRWALDRMDRGLAPWKRPLTLREIRLFSGHKTDSQVVRYLRPSVREAEQLTRGSSVVEDVKPDVTGLGFTATSADQIDMAPDDSVAFATG